jgi:hypothetical protein
MSKSCTCFFCGCARRCISCTGSVAVVLADARPAALIAPASLVVVLADARPTSMLAPASLAVAFANARPVAWLVTGSFGGCAGTLRPPSSQCLFLPPQLPLPPHTESSLMLPCRLPRTKRGRVFFYLTFLVLVFGLFLSLAFELLASLTARPLFCRLVPPSITHIRHDNPSI